MPLSYFLSKSELKYWMIPAIEIKRSKGISRDKADSKYIALYSLTNLLKLKLGSILDETLHEIKQLHTERMKLVKIIKMIERGTENIDFLPKKILSDMLIIHASTIIKPNENMKRIDKKIQDLLAQNEDLKEKDKLIQNIPGKDPQTSIYLLLVIRGFSSFDNSRQLACYVGVAPIENSSGSSIRGRKKVSHLADKTLKSLLNMCELNAKAWDYELKQHYDRNVSEGKPKMLILYNIRNKILGRVFAVINLGILYVNTRKFAA